MASTGTDEPRLNDVRTTNAVYRRFTQDREIRLLELFPGAGDEKVVCELHHSVISEAKDRYEAISYRWGDEEDKIDIICNKQEFFTTRNLHEGLVRLRQERKSRWLWADQICINQNDNDEKEHRQIPLMADIYASSSMVLVWLSKKEGSIQDDRELDIAMESLPRLFGRVREAAEMGYQAMGLRGIEVGLLHDLLSHPWFTRVWTLQEVAMAETAVVLYGKKEFDWDLLRRFSDYCQNDCGGFWTTILRDVASASSKRSGEYGRYVTGNVIAITQPQVDRAATAASGVRPGDALHLHRLRSCDASKPKDRVLAILHWFSQELKDHLVSINHGRGIAKDSDFYTNVAIFKLQERRDVDFFSAAGLVQSSRSPDRFMPSWVPDWTTPEATHDLWMLDRLRRMKSDDYLYNASDTQGGIVEVSVDGRLLTVQAKIIDEVDAVEAPAKASIRNDPGNAEIDWRQQALKMGRERHKLIDACLQLAERCKAHYGDSWGPACRQTLMRGIVREGIGPSVGGLQKRATDEELEILFHDYQTIIEFTGLPTFLKLPVSPAVSLRTPWQILENHLQKVRLIEQIQDSFKGRVFFTTKHGYMGLGPYVEIRAKTTFGDKICVVRGCCTPFVIRPVEATPAGGEERVLYELIGEAYVHGLMDGEAAKRSDVPWKSVTFQ